MSGAVAGRPQRTCGARIQQKARIAICEGTYSEPTASKVLMQDGDCNRVICDNIDTSTPVEVD